jgi:ribosomal-protein-alanine N-acetyltransferase
MVVTETWRERIVKAMQISGEIRVHIRWLVSRDMVEVLDIERESFEFPWSEEDYLRCLRSRNCIGMVAECHDQVVGYMVYELGKNKIQLLNMATASQFRRCGVATQMIAKLIGKLSLQRRNRITFEIRETNLTAQLFFRSVGFRATQILKNYYEQMQEDAYFMQYRHAPDTNADVYTEAHNRIIQYLT